MMSRGAYDLSKPTTLTNSKGDIAEPLFPHRVGIKVIMR